MRVKVDLAKLQQTSWQDYAIRFVFGGLVTAIACLIGKQFGPTVGGLFLAFPAILPASVTLIEKHEARKSAGYDTLGAAIGSIGLLAFAATVWALARQQPAWVVMSAATLAWFAVSAVIWMVLQLPLPHHKR